MRLLQGEAKESAGLQARRRNLTIFAVVFIAWLAFDMLSKSLLSDASVGEVIAGPFFGIFQFALVHNTGAAWGIFGDSTVALGAFSLVVCIAALLYMFVVEPGMRPIGALGLSLVVAGGVGNAIDRFSLGYVVDFIEPVFIDFPVFNIADIGVTCGMALFVLSLVLDMIAPDGDGALGGGGDR